MKNRDNNKTIFFLGAGFSKDAGAPLQSEILDKISTFDADKLIKDHPGRYNEVDKIRDLERLKCFINENFLAEINNAELEDIYTPVDRCIIDGVSFKGKTPEELVEIRNKLNSIIALIMDEQLTYRVSDDYIRNFAEYIVEQNRSRSIGDKSVVITSNWDILLDNRISEYIGGSGDVVDYCCHYTHYNDSEAFPPPLIAIERKNHTHKILKLHGSLNWLWCSNCGRIQVKFWEKIALDGYFNDPECRFCGAHSFVPQILMPTFLKDNTNTQLRNVWNQAGLELLETKRIVFIGYSFPLADFEIRQMLARFITSDVEIEIVLRDDNNPDNYSHLDNKIRNKVVWNLASSRYERYFAKNKPLFYFDGVQDYINKKLLGGA